MKTTVLAAMLSHLGGNATTLCTCWKVARRDGQVLGFTDHDRDLSIDISDGDGLVTYKASTGYARSAVSQSSTLETDSLEVNSFLSSTAITEEDIRAGRYDQATVTIFLVNHQDTFTLGVPSMGRIPLKKGYTATLGRKGQMLVVELLGLLKAFDREILRTVQPLCNADFGDARCTVVPSQIAGTVAAVTSSREFLANVGFTGTAINMANGRVIWGVGAANYGEKSVIKSYDAGTRVMKLFLPAPVLPVVGDTFMAAHGCRKTVADCRDRHSNIINFRGFPLTPTTDTMLSLPRLVPITPLNIGGN
jgi:uncharacterized phage protein (TIGR02218 family)